MVNRDRAIAAVIVLFDLAMVLTILVYSVSYGALMERETPAILLLLAATLAMLVAEIAWDRKHQPPITPDKGRTVLCG